MKLCLHVVVPKHVCYPQSIQARKGKGNHRPYVIQVSLWMFMKQLPKTDKTRFEVDGKASAYLFDQNSFKPYLKLLEGASMHLQLAAVVETGCWFHPFQPVLNRWFELVLKPCWMSTLVWLIIPMIACIYGVHLRGSSPLIPPEAHMDHCISQHCVSECLIRRDHQDEERRVQHVGGTRQRRSGIDMFEQCSPCEWWQSQQYFTSRSFSRFHEQWRLHCDCLSMFECKWCTPFSRY